MFVSNSTMKYGHRLKRKSYFSIGLAGVFFLAWMLLMVLMLNGSAAMPGDVSVSNVVNVSDNQILSANGAIPGAELHFRTKRATPEERRAAAERFKEIYRPVRVQSQALAFAQGVPAAAAALDPGGVPHYFGPYANWANSPMPRGAIINIAVTDGGSGYALPNVTVNVTDAYNNTGVTSAVAVATVGAGGTITNITVTNGGSGYTAPIVTITGANTTPASATASIGGPLAGGIRKFVDSLPGLNASGKNDLGQYMPVAVSNKTAYPGSDYYEIAVVQYSEKMHKDLPKTTLRGYVQIEETPFPPSSKHVQLFYPNGTAIRNATTGLPVFAYNETQYMGPIIIAKRGVPVRVKFHNYLPNDVDGDLFIPVDHTVMGSGMGPLGMNATPMNYSENRAAVHLHGGDTVWISDGTPHQWTTPAGEHTSYPEGVSVRDVPDMDGGKEPQGTLTFYYTNNMSARLMFYHDHAYGITRLNVYSGMAAGYLITDRVEQDLIKGTNVMGVNPNNSTVLPGVGIPLVIQDRTFVDNTTVAAQDPTWNWGTGPRVAGKITKAMTGDLWMPHVYMTNQNPWDITGTNAFGRWMYSPWFWPPATPTVRGLIPNPYYTGGAGTAPWEPPMIPGTPNPSMAMEAFMDTPLVNGAAYPNLTVEPKAYRFRILNAANERFLNLQLYLASSIINNITVINGGSGYTLPSISITDPTGYGRGATARATISGGNITGISILTVGSNYTAPVVTITDPTGKGATATAKVYTGLTEVGMVPASNCGGLPLSWPVDGRDGGVPDPLRMGPSFIQIGTEGGYLPKPVVVENQPVTFIANPQAFNFGNVEKHAVLLGPAERADVIIDFSKYAGKTIILYNDAPAAFPAADPRVDYYTHDVDQRDTGGAPTTQPGFGPNTRTIMQIKVNNSAPSSAYNLIALNQVFAKKTGKRGVFELTQPPIIVPQAAYDSAYNKTFPFDVVRQYVQLYQNSHVFENISGSPLNISLEPKAIHDEMNAAYDTQYGRMSGMLGLEMPGTNPLTQNFMLYGFASPPVEVIEDSMTPLSEPSAGDGTQLWKITHNGVDTHTYHFHLYNVQVINRVAWDGILLPPDANELGWKETVRTDPLEHTIVALRPVAPRVPFKVPNSTRLIDPTMPAGDILTGPPGGFLDPAGNPVTVLNHLVNFGWEYMIHCHLLGHEEMDMMHAQVFAVAPEAPTNLKATAAISGSPVNLTWVDNSISETGFAIQRATNANFTANLTTFKVGPNVVKYNDSTAVPGTGYYYRVRAVNVVGDTTVYPAPAVGFPQKTVYSAFSNTVAPPSHIGVFRSGAWFFDINGNGVWDPASGDLLSFFGTTGDLPAAGDWNSDNKDEIGVLRNGAWYLDYNGNRVWDPASGDVSFWFGTSGDLPAAGDWNGDNKDEIGVLRNGAWYLDYNGNRVWDAGDMLSFFGTTGDQPIAGRWS
jgi:FtsP/CotA-like multicopper oxidase with cupredoxin domain